MSGYTLKLHKYFNGRVMSIGCADEQGHEIRTGIILPGEHNFGKEGHNEKIILIKGFLSINGTFIASENQSIRIKAGELKRLQAIKPIVYISYCP